MMKKTLFPQNALLKIIGFSLISLLLASCSHPYQRHTYEHSYRTNPSNAKNPPNKALNNICKIYQHDTSWKKAARQSYRRWGTPEYVLMAIVYQESKFKKHASPSYRGASQSSAYGYAQAQPGTWREYQKSTHRPHAKRTSIYDALDFIGWYNNISYKRNHIAKNNAKHLYLAYHEGNGGYARKTYRKKRWLLKVSDQVARQAKVYRHQLRLCH